MNRRNFILKVAAAAAFLPFLTLDSCTNEVVENEDKGSNKNDIDNFELSEITIADLQKKMESGELTSQKITELYLSRIEKIDKNGVKLNSVIEINPEALSIAQSLDEERKAGKVRGQMHGIPVLLKDNIDTHDKMFTTAGSLALLGNIASKDAYIVDLLRKAGAVILGKTNLSEFANFRSTHSSSGWSSRGGQTKNPYIISRNPCGSSSGSGAAVSANLCTIAIGTETDGSIICPSAINGIVGIKPTVGLWSRSGIIPISFTQDTAGPMARTVADAAILLGLLMGEDTEDSKTAANPNKSPIDYTQFLLADGLKGKNIGIQKGALNMPNDEANILLNKALEQIKQQGGNIIEFDETPSSEISNAEYEVLYFEFKDGLNKYLSTSNAKVKSLQEVIDFNRNNEATAMPYFKQEILEHSQTKGDLQSKEYVEALKKSQFGASQFIDNLFVKYNLHAICGVQYSPSWCTDLINGDHFVNYPMNIPSAPAGYPSISVPMGFVQELPLGLTFIGKAFSEAQLIPLAYAYEQVSKNRRAPKFLT